VASDLPLPTTGFVIRVYSPLHFPVGQIDQKHFRLPSLRPPPLTYRSFPLPPSCRGTISNQSLFFFYHLLFVRVLVLDCHLSLSRIPVFPPFFQYFSSFFFLIGCDGFNSLPPIPRLAVSLQQVERRKVFLEDLRSFFSPSFLSLFVPSVHNRIGCDPTPTNTSIDLNGPNFSLFFSLLCCFEDLEPFFPPPPFHRCVPLAKFVPLQFNF